MTHRHVLVLFLWAFGTMPVLLVSLARSAETVTYDYDDLGRLNKATYGDGKNTTYTLDAAGNRLNVATQQGVDASPPTAPGVPTFSNIAETTATATWALANDDRGVVGYEYRIGTTGAWVAVPNVLTTTITGLVPGTTQTVYVRAKDAAPNYGPPSSGPVTTIDVTAPGAPASISVGSIGETSASLSWGAASDNNRIASYEYQLNGGAFSNVGTNQLVSLASLTANTRYDVNVRARDPANLPGAVRSATFYTLDLTPPGAPSNLSLSISSETAFTASWSAASDNASAPVSYDYRLWSNGSLVRDWSALGLATGGYIGALQGRVTYTIDVRARDGVGLPGPYISGTITMPDWTPPPAPTNLSFENLASDKVDVHWLSYPWPSDVIAQEYSLNGGAWISVGLTQAAYLTGLTPNTTYSISIRQRDDANNPSTPLSGQFTTTEAWYQISDNGGVIVPSATGLYSVGTTCDGGSPYPTCVTAIRKKYGDLGVVWSWTFDLFTPACTIGDGIAGYRAPYGNCRVEANSAAYGH